MIDPREVRTVGIVGAGAIGASWAALALSRGLRVLVWDPDPDARERLHEQVTRWTGEPSSDDRAVFTAGLEELAGDADVVFEAGPESLGLKREVFRRLDAVAGAGVLLTSSSSGLTPSSLQEACGRYPERVLVAHPFNPPHLVPLVEVVGGRQTSESAVEMAIALLRHLGKEPVRIHREVRGHVANRLQAALWREAYHLVEQGVVSVADLDTVVASGPGLRWALLGPMATQHLSGGPGGLAHVLDHLGPPMVEWWEDLGQPELTPQLVDRLVAGVETALAGVDVADLTDRRDRALRSLLQVKSAEGLGGPHADRTEGA